MTIVAEQYSHVIGVDTHAASHTYAIIDTRNGGVVGKTSFPTHPAGLARAITWMRGRSGPNIAAAVEGTGFYGAQLTRALEAEQVTVYEVRPPARGSRARDGKTDTFDAIAAARSILHADSSRLATPKQAGTRAAIGVLNTARKTMKKDKNRATQQLIALLRTYPLGIDAREKLAKKTITVIAAWRTRANDPVDHATARAEAVRLARRILALRDDLKTNERRLGQLVQQAAPSLLTLQGVGVISAAVIIDAFSHKGRIHSADAFARMAGAAPLPVQSGKTSRHRLNRGQNRALNSALHTIVKDRLKRDKKTIAYAKQRAAENHTTKDIQRLLKRYVARQIFRHLETNLA